MNKSVLAVLMVLLAFPAAGLSQNDQEKQKEKARIATNDSLEYRLIVLDPGFDTWLATRPVMGFYSNDYYLQRNRFYVAEWNLRYQTRNYSGLYDSYIDYRPNNDYGLEFNYRLYYFFKFFEETNHIKLLNTSR